MIRPLLVVLMALVAAAGTAACSADGDPRELATGEVVAASYTAANDGTPVHVMLPSGRADLTLGEPTDEAPAATVDGGALLVAKEGDVLVQVSWSLDRAALPDDINRQVVGLDTLHGEPKSVGLRLVGGEESVDLGDVGTLGEPVAGRPATAIWLAVPEAVSQWSFEVDYDGLVQTVDADTGHGGPSIASVIPDGLPAASSGLCDVGGNDYTSCLVDSAIGFPYADGPGWAPAGQTYAVVTTSVEGERGVEVTLDGRPAAAVVRDRTYTYDVFLVRPGRTLALAGETTLAGGRTVPLSGSINQGESR